MIAIEESAFVGLMVLLGLLLAILTIKPVMIQKQYTCVHCNRQSTIYLKGYAFFGIYVIPLLMKDVTEKVNKTIEKPFFGVKVIDYIESLPE